MIRKNEISQPIETVYIGGGTPSLMDFTDLSSLIDSMRDIFDLQNIYEFTIEANPDDISYEFIDAIRSIGINRLSIGIQSFDNAQLKSLGRSHSAGTARTAMLILSDSGINYNADLIYGLPGQTLPEWQESLNELLTFKPPHISAYLLSFEPGTRLYAQMIAGKVTETDETIVKEMYDILCLRMRAYGYSHYEISNFSLPGFHSRHNSSYWNMTPYLGLGVSSHSFDGYVRRYNPSDLKRYCSGVYPGYIEESASLESRFNDMIITSLRTQRGLSLTDVSLKFGNTYTDRLLKDAQKFISNGIMSILHGQTLIINEDHWLTSDAIMRDLLVIDDD